MPLVSVVIPTKDRPLAVVDAVRSVCAGDYQDFEIYVVDQSLERATRDALAAFSRDARFHYVWNTRSRPGPASSRNIGIALSSGEIVAIIDDDVTVCRDWMANLVAEFAADPALQFICGKLSAPPDEHVGGFVPTFDPDRIGAALTNWRMPLASAGANYSMRRTLFERIGGYDELFGPGSPYGVSDDGDMSFRIMRSGAKWKACSSVEVVHTHGYRPFGHDAKLLKSYQVGLGANFGRFTRHGDIAAGLRFIFLELHRVATVVVPNVMHRRRPTRAGWVLDRLTGFWRGLWLPPHDGVVTPAELARLRLEWAEESPSIAPAESRR